MEEENAYEVDGRHVAAGDLVLTPSPAPPVCLGQQKSRYEYHRPWHFVRGRLLLDDFL